MPIIGPSSSANAPIQQATTTAQAIINSASQEVRGVLDATVTNDQTILLDYVNRAQLALLRASRWNFLLSQPVYFITQREQTDYYIGIAGQAPAGTVDTLLNLNNVDLVARNSVRDVSNDVVLQKMDNKPFSPTISTDDAQFRPGPPAAWVNDLGNAQILSIYPAPNNQNSWQPIPQTPYLTITPGGALPARTYLIQTTFVDSIGGEGAPCAREGVVNIPAGFLCKVNSPVMPYNITESGVSYDQYNIYAVGIPNPNAAPQFSNTETKQTVSPINIGTNWIEPTSGLTNTGVSTPNGTNVTLTQMGGYLIEFRYFQDRITISNLNQILLIPDVYFDIMVAGVTAYACQYLRLKDEAQYWSALFTDGIRQMVRDKNLFPREADYINPDAVTVGIGSNTPYLDTYNMFGNI